LTAKTAWIVGASSGIGAALAKRLAALGWQVAISARRVERLEALAKENVALVPFPLDSGDRDAAARVAADIVAKFGHIDLAVYSAAEWHKNTIGDYEAARYAAVTRVDFLGAVNVIDPVVRHMRETTGGQIAIVASLAGYYGFPSGGPYGAAKAALIQLAQTMRGELWRDGIDVRLVSPGFVATELTAHNRYDMPFLMSADEAARRIEQGLMRSRRFEIAFPWQMVWAAKAGRLLPYPIFFRAMREMLKRVERR
jgi:NAD(P)-dependent dehydrogenase (short-subunit alcohol dehydrogenase family)